MKGWIGGLCVVLAACLVPQESRAACAPRFQITLADGSRTCLTDHPVANVKPAGQLFRLKDMMPASGNYVLAMPPISKACPAVAGFVVSGQSAPAALEQRADQALRECNWAVRRADGPGECRCGVVLADGATRMSAGDFAQLARHGPEVAVGSEPARGAGGTTPQAGTSSPAAAAAPGVTAGPSNADIVALRQQIELLRAEMARSDPAGGPGAPARAAGPRLKARALVIGNGAYSSLGMLGNPRNDAQAIGEKLRKFGVEVDLVIDADRGALVKALADYQTRSGGYDVNIFFYAGHGLQIGGTNYLVPVDLPASGASVGSVKLNAISLNDVLEYMAAPTRLVFLDACRDNPLSRSLVASRSTAGVGLAPVNTTSGTLVAYATKDGATAEDGGGHNSPYTTALLQHLDAEEDIAVVLRRVRQAVLKATGNRQEPWEYGSLIGEQLVLSRIGR